MAPPIPVVRPGSTSTPTQPVTDISQPVGGNDVDDAELALARSALAAEEGTGGTGDTPPTPPAPPAPAPRAPVATPGEPDAVPIGRFKEVYGKARELEQENLILRGRNEALSDLARGGQQPGAQPPAPPAPRVDPLTEKIASARAAMVQLAADYDEGKLSGLKEYEEKRLALQDQLETAVDQRTTQRINDAVRQVADKPSYTDETVLENLTVTLEQQHPYITVMKEGDVEALVSIAETELAREGNPIKGGIADTVRLRERVAELSSEFGPRWYPDAQVPQPSAPAATRPGSTPTPEQRGKKLELQTRLPPDTRQIGTSGTQTEMNDAQILALNEADAEALPASVRAKYLNS